ncbi:PadR family transcriptional regulator [Paenibacillus thermoaerophilus]|jgi:PadR family transcriptional regulator PadR|uniref:PadR family transcriptional regulator n=1 Tax=Paenibacillus thermoaerophilus TaxID=1215385 RepID=A0ABW2V1Z5_9BACL|nr:helix-turn-helix transcriptional regulator [Paenibacillus thermoaerophilus]TMV18200.1 PadR family transcriptional regulator [Paenibacillus thermoaerophilus]
MGKTELVKGSTEVILLSLLSQRDMYGYELAQRIEADSEGYLQLGEGTLYPALKRLELQGYVESYWQSSEAGPRRKYYAITESGRSALAAMTEEWNRFERIMRRLTGYVRT